MQQDALVTPGEQLGEQLLGLDHVAGGGPVAALGKAGRSPRNAPREVGLERGEGVGVDRTGVQAVGEVEYVAEVVAALTDPAEEVHQECVVLGFGAEDARGAVAGPRPQGGDLGGTRGLVHRQLEDGLVPVGVEALDAQRLRPAGEDHLGGQLPGIEEQLRPADGLAQPTLGLGLTQPVGEVLAKRVGNGWNCVCHVVVPQTPCCRRPPTLLGTMGPSVETWTVCKPSAT